MSVEARGPVHVLDPGRYYAEVVGGIPMIFRADTAGAVTHIEAGDENRSPLDFTKSLQTADSVAPGGIEPPSRSLLESPDFQQLRPGGE